MAQTTYSNDLTEALAGMLADSNGAEEITSRAASEAIPAGRACVLDAGGTVSLPKTATAVLPTSGTGSLVGISVYTSASPAGGYQIGDMVPLVKRGRVWADFTGTGATENETMQICHASDDSNSELANRGKFSDAAASTTAGHEKTAQTRLRALGGISTTLAKIEINLP